MNSDIAAAALLATGLATLNAGRVVSWLKGLVKRNGEEPVAEDEIAPLLTKLRHKASECTDAERRLEYFVALDVLERMKGDQQTLQIQGPQ